MKMSLTALAVYGLFMIATNKACDTVYIPLPKISAQESVLVKGFLDLEVNRYTQAIIKEKMQQQKAEFNEERKKSFIEVMRYFKYRIEYTFPTDSQEPLAQLIRSEIAKKPESTKAQWGFLGTYYTIFYQANANTIHSTVDVNPDEITRAIAYKNVNQ